MLYAILDNGQTLALDRVQVTDSQGDISTFQIECLRSQLIRDPRDMRLESVSVYRGRRLIISGVIEDASLSLKEEGMSVSFNCTQEIGRLTFRRARANVQIDNQTLLFALAYLLDYSDGFQLRDITTFSDTSQVVSLDLSGKENLWSQIKQIIDSLPDTFFRYGGYDAISGNHQIDIGAFGDQSQRSLIQGRNIVDLELKSRLVVPICEIEAYGGEYSSGTAVTLADAVEPTADPTLLSHPDYPIVLKDDGAYVVRNKNFCFPIETSDLVSYWSFESKIELQWLDDHRDNDLQGIVPTSTTTGIVGNSAAMVAANGDNMIILHEAQQGLDFTGEFTLTAWVLLGSLPSSAGNDFGVINKYDDANEKSYILYIRESDNVPCFSISDDGVIDVVLAASSFGALTTSQWYFLCARYDGANMKISVGNSTVLEHDTKTHTFGVHAGTSDFKVGT